MARFITKSTSWAAALVAALALGGCCSGPESTSDKFETIPLDKIYTTSEQKGLKRLSLGATSFSDQDLVERFLRLSPRTSNLFLGTAKDINDAIRAGLRFRARSEVLLPKQDDKSQIWIILFLGFRSSDPPQWILESVERNQCRICVTYSVESQLAPKTRDLHPYFYWIPLPVGPS